MIATVTILTLLTVLVVIDEHANTSSPTGNDCPCGPRCPIRHKLAAAKSLPTGR